MTNQNLGEGGAFCIFRIRGRRWGVEWEKNCKIKVRIGGERGEGCIWLFRIWGNGGQKFLQCPKAALQF